MIEKNIFQTWYTKELDPELQAIRKEMLDINPDWTYYLYDDNDMDLFVKNKYPGRIYNAYSKLNIVTAKADLWRYLVLYTFGGVYLDMDSIITTSLDTLLKDTDDAVITAETNPGVYVQWALIYKKGHPILESVIDIIISNIENNTYPNDILKMTGPIAYTKGIELYHATLYNQPIQHSLITHSTDITYSQGPKYRIYGIDYNGNFLFHHPKYQLLYKNKPHWTDQKSLPLLK